MKNSFFGMRAPVPGAGWILLAAAAVPVVIKVARPLARRLGQGMETVGKKLVEAAEQSARDAAARPPDAPPAEPAADDANVEPGPAPEGEDPKPGSAKPRPRKRQPRDSVAKAKPRPRRRPPAAG